MEKFWVRSSPSFKPIRILVNWGLALCVLFLAVIHFFRFSNAPWHLSHLLLGLQFFLVSLFFLVRDDPSVVSWHPWDVILCLAAVFAPLFFSREHDRGLLPGMILQSLGSLISIAAIASLGRSFGILPANRGIRQGHLYRFIRHPMYAGYQIANLGYLLNHPSPYNLLLGLLAFLAQILRIFREEALLGRDPAYQRYRQEVRWRLVPFVF